MAPVLEAPRFQFAHMQPLGAASLPGSILKQPQILQIHPD
jgi:hypothetical protein